MSTTKLEIHNPATGQKIADIESTAPEEVARAVTRAQSAQVSWQTKSFAERGKILFRFRDYLLDEQEKLVDILTAETGKPRAEAFGNELFYLCDAIGFWAKRTPTFLKPEKIRPHLFKMKKVVSTYSPLGVIGIISPWNFPLVMTIGEALPALMAGNAVVIKPSELTPLSPQFAVELARAAGFPKDLLQVVFGFAETGEALIDHVDMIAFTGSVETGQKVMRRAAERLTPVTLELGGKDPMIVLKDADLERAAGACVWGALMNSGQVCTSIERVYVEEPVYHAFVQKVVERVKVLRQGPSSDEVDLGSMNSTAQLEMVERQVNEAVEKGARILAGGRRNGSLGGLYFEPTVLVDVTHDMSVMREETFGPVIPILKVKNPEEALKLANDSRFGLDGSVFSGSREQAWAIAQGLDAGSVCINDSLVNFIITDAPMGGIKESGFGRRHGADGIRKYCRQKTIVTDRFGLKEEFPWFPATAKKTRQMRFLLDVLYRSGWRNKLRAFRRLKAD